MKEILIIALILFSGCGESNMATMAEEVSSNLVTTNVTDETPEFDLTNITFSAGRLFEKYTIENGVLYSAGQNEYGELGLGDTASHASYTATNVDDVKNVFSGFGLAMVLKKDGSLWASGDNSNGRFGNGNFESSTVFIDTKIQNVKYVSICESFVLILKYDGSVWKTGDYLKLPIDMGLSKIVKVATGRTSGYAIDENNDLYVYGFNDYGQLGDTTNTNANQFTLNSDVGKVLNVVAGFYHSIVIKVDGNLATTGYNAQGQLGLNDTTDRNTYVDVGITDAIQIAANTYGTYIVKQDNSLWGTGTFQDYLGGRSTNVFTNTNVAGVKYISCGYTNIFALKTDDSLFYSDTLNTFSNQSRTIDEYSPLSWRLFNSSEIYQSNGKLYYIIVNDVEQSFFATKTEIGYTNPLKAFDGQNITPSIYTSPMTYTISSNDDFNSFVLAKVLADSLTYTFYDSLDNVIKTETVSIDCKRDDAGLYKKYPTTVMMYADEQIEAGGYVSIELTKTDGDIELGDFTLNNAIDIGFTNLSFSHGIKDFNNYTPDAFGIIPSSNKAVVTTFKITVDIPITNYDYMVSLNESISGKNIAIDGSDSKGQSIDSRNVFASMIRRVRVTSVEIASKIKDSMVDAYATLTLSVQEIV